MLSQKSQTYQITRNYVLENFYVHEVLGRIPDSEYVTILIYPGYPNLPQFAIHLPSSCPLSSSPNRHFAISICSSSFSVELEFRHSERSMLQGSEARLDFPKKIRWRKLYHILFPHLYYWGYDSTYFPRLLGRLYEL